MKIAMIQDDWSPRTGGGPVHVKELSSALAKYHGCDVDIYTRALKQDGNRYESTQQLQDGNVTVYRLPPCTEYWNPIGRVSSMVTPLPSLLRGEYEIVHGHTFLPAVPTRLAGFTKATTVFTVHGTALPSGVRYDDSKIGGIKPRIEKRLILGFDYDRVISVNEEHVGLLEEHHSSVQTIPNGVDCERFSVDAQRSNDILFLGRLSPKKGVSDLIEAFAMVESEFPESNLRIVGEGPESKELKEKVESLDVKNRVEFTGRVSDEQIPLHYRSAGAFVLPSLWEGHPLTLLEAWASETPVIASSVEGIEEFVNHKETGFLVPPESPQSLAEAIRFTLENPKKAYQWGQNGHQLVKEEYSWEGVADATYRLYRDALEKRSR